MSVPFCGQARKHVRTLALGLRNTFEEPPGFTAAIAGTVGSNKNGTTLLAVPCAMAVLVAVAGDDAVHTWRPLDSNGTAPGVAVA